MGGGLCKLKNRRDERFKREEEIGERKETLGERRPFPRGSITELFFFNLLHQRGENKCETTSLCLTDIPQHHK